MSVIEKLIETASADTELLYTLNDKGDDFSISRKVEFLLISREKEKAEAAAGFLADYQYGETAIDEVDGEYRVLVTVNMPIQQQVILSVSGFIACIAELFSVKYDGWGCVAQSTSN